jgi:hypothetical protein
MASNSKKRHAIQKRKLKKSGKVRKRAVRSAALKSRETKVDLL